MLRKRIFFTLIYSDGYFHQSRNFRLQRVGNLEWLKKNYNFSKTARSIDELVILNASRGKKNIDEFSNVVRDTIDEVFIPVTCGGGVKNLSDASKLFNNGADKILMNSCLYRDPGVINEIASVYGAQCVVASVDYKNIDNEFIAFSNNGSKNELSAIDHINSLEGYNYGEIFLNSIDQDGTGFGYDFSILDSLKNLQNPIIFSGGAGNFEHFLEGFETRKLQALSTANLLNFVGDGLDKSRSKLISNGMNLADWRY